MQLLVWQTVLNGAMFARQLEMRRIWKSWRLGATILSATKHFEEEYIFKKKHISINVWIPCIYTFSPGWQRALPPGYQHLVCAFKAEEQRVVLKIKLSLREQVENWLKDFQLSSSLTWRKARTYPESGRYNTYRVSTAWKLSQQGNRGPRWCNVMRVWGAFDS